MKKIILIFLVFLLAGSVLSYQQKMTLRECVYSFNDPNFNSWDETSQAGVFLNISNTNLNLGLTENPNYVIKTYQPERDYFNNFESKTAKSKIPILQINNGDNGIYAQCRFKVGDYRIFPTQAMFFHGGPGSPVLYPTHDFNLTIGLFSSKVFQGYGYSMWAANNNSEFSYYSQMASIWPGDLSNLFGSGIYYFNNGVEEGTTQSQYLEKGIYPNTELIIRTRANLTGAPTSLVQFYGYMRENAYQDLIIPFVNGWLYLNSSTPMDGKFLMPVNTRSEITDSNGNVKQTPSIINAGDNVYYKYTAKNPFPIALSDIILTCNYETNVQWQGGVGYADNLNFVSTIRTIVNASFAPGEEKSVYFNFTVPAGTSAIRTTLGLWGESRGARELRAKAVTPYFSLFKVLALPSGTFYVGADSVEYLGFYRFDSRIEMIESGDDFIPIFKLPTQLFVVNNSPFVPQITANEYEILVNVFNNSNLASQNNIDSIRIPLNETVFKEMGLESQALRIGSGSDYTNPSFNLYNLLVPIKSKYMSYGELYVKPYSVKLTDPFRNYKIASLMTTPTFQPGDILYSLNDVITFGNDSKIGRESVYVFNPSFYNISIQLGINWTDSQNFTFKWEGGSAFEKNPIKIVSLKPLEKQMLNFDINATYTLWVNAIKLERADISANTTIRSSEATLSPKSSKVSFILNVTPFNLNDFNLRPMESLTSDSDIELDFGENSKFETKYANWTVVGGTKSLDSYYGKEYNVSVSLKNSDGLILNESKKRFNITSLGEMKSLGISYNLSAGEYAVLLELDTENEIDETGNGESDNRRNYDLRVSRGSCEYNSTENKLYFYDNFGVKHLDTGCICDCPQSGQSCIIGQASCISDDDSRCSSFGSLSTCNIDHDVFRCGWECNSLTCPPGNSNLGDCLRCADILDSCWGYNNKETCNTDPCSKKEYDCDAVSCDRGKSYYCNWNDASNECEFQIMGDGGFFCSYSSVVLQRCAEGAGMEIINFSGIPSSLCPSAIRSFPCETAGLPFFSIFSLIAFALFTALFYLLRKS